MKYKAIISDLDGTLLNDQHVFSDYTKEVLRAAVEKGYKLMIATGRHHCDLNYMVDKTLKLPIYRISSNGARSFSPDGKLLFKCDIDAALSRQMIDLSCDPDVYRHVYKNDSWYSDKYDEMADSYHTLSGFVMEVVDFSSFDFSDCMKVFYISPDTDKLKEIENRISQIGQDRLYLTYSMPFCFEVLNSQANKANAAEDILKKLGISWEETVAFGDGLNDREMLQKAGCGRVMENGDEELKKALPEDSLIGRNNSDSVARFIEKNLL